MGVGGPYVCAGRVVLGSRPRDRPRRPRWAVEVYAGNHQRDTEDLQRRGYLDSLPTERSTIGSETYQR